MKKHSSTVTFSKILVFATVSLIMIFKFLSDIFPPWFEVWNGLPEAHKRFHLIKTF